MRSTKASKPAAEFSARGPRGSNRLGNQIAAESIQSQATNQDGKRLGKRDYHFSIRLYGCFRPPEFSVDVSCPNEGAQFTAYKGPDFAKALKVALEESRLHDLAVAYRFWVEVRA